MYEQMVALIVAGLSMNALVAAPAAGSLDPTFGHAGRVAIDMPLTPTSVVVAPDGRIVVSGDLGNVAGRVAVVRLLQNGRLDPSFGTGGVAALTMGTAMSLTLQPDGKILIAGDAASAPDAELIRLQADGQADPSFGHGGAVIFDYVANSSNEALVTLVAPSGAIVAGGFGLSPTSDAYLTSLARFTPSGELDTSFGTNGIVALDLVGGVTALGLQSDAKILVCGGFITPAKALVVRFLPNGRLDRNDSGGVLTAVAHTGSQTFGGTNEFQRDGKLARWTSASRNRGQDVEVTRLLRNNGLDPNFDGRPFAFGSPDRNVPLDVQIAAGGSLLVAGAASTNGGAAAFGLARLTPSGALDPSFGKAGRVLTTFAGSAEATALAIAPDGKIVAAGATTADSTMSLVLARYLAK